jgi:hypothetical protein
MECHRTFGMNKLDHLGQETNRSAIACDGNTIVKGTAPHSIQSILVDRPFGVSQLGLPPNKNQIYVRPLAAENLWQFRL